MIPRLGAAVADRHGVALDGKLRNEDTDLASTTLYVLYTIGRHGFSKRAKRLSHFLYRMANSDDRDSFGIVVTYVVKARLFLGALAGELVGELPIILMHPKVINKPLVLPRL